MTESVERPDPPLSNSVESNERLEVHQANPMECTGRRGTPPSDTIGDNERVVGLPISDEIIEINHLKAPLARPSIEHSHYPALKGIDIKAETGYSSYADYVEAYCANRPYLERVLLFIGAGENVASKYGITILDLVKEGSSLPRVVWRCQSQSARNILMTLRQPPAYAALQIVLWNATDYLIPNLVNKLGLGLKIDPRFFEALDEESRRRRHWDPKHVTINGAVATVIRHYNTEEVDVAPIVFIAGMQWESESMIAAEEDIGGTLPFQHPAARTYPFHSPPYDRVGYFPGQYEHPNYIRLLEWYFEKDKDLPSSGTDLMLQPLIPLFYLSIFRIREFCKSVRHEYDIIHKEDRATAWWANTRENIISGLPKKRLRLRAMVEDSEDALDHFLRYIGSQHSADYLSTQSWLKAEGDIKRTHQEAARLEAQIRDYLQIQVGEWALQESRRSIEVSNRQIEEGKRVKICKRGNQAHKEFEDVNITAVTILAFVYAPLNLATSIFGMNLSELNESGKDVRVFLTTAIVALVITGASWFFIEEFNNYLKWKRSHAARTQGNRSLNARMQLPLGARIGMLALLWHYGHKSWMWRSGAWWRILTNNSSGLSQGTQAKGPSACEYVWEHTVGSRFPRDEAFKPDVIYEWKK